MGLYDTVCWHLPIEELANIKFQTKALACEMLDFHVTSEGQLVEHFHPEWMRWRWPDPPEPIWPQDYSGRLVFYDKGPTYAAD